MEIIRVSLQYFVFNEFISASLLVHNKWLIITMILVLFTAFYLKDIIVGYREKFYLRFQEELQEFVVNYIAFDIKSKEKKQVLKQIKSIAKYDFNRKVLLEVILRLHTNLSGVYCDRLEKLYVDIGLEVYAIKKLKNKQCRKKMEGLRELVQLGITKNVLKELVSYLDHENRFFRVEIQLAMVKLFGNNGLSFLDDYKDSLHEWQQLEIIEALSKLEDVELTHIRIWLTSENISVVKFALKLVDVYSLVVYEQSLIALLYHEEVEIRIISLKLIEKLKITAAISTLRSRFKNNDYQEENIQILNTLHSLGTTYFSDDLISLKGTDRSRIIKISS